MPAPSPAAVPTASAKSTVPGKVGEYVTFFIGEWGRSHWRALLVSAILIVVVFIGYTAKLVIPDIVKEEQNKVKESLKRKRWPGPWAPVMTKGDAKSWKVVRGTPWQNAPLDPAGNTMALKVSAESFGFVNLIDYILGDYDAKFTIRLNSRQEPVAWIVRGKDEKDYFSIKYSFSGDVHKGDIGNHVADGCLYHAGKSVTCVQRPDLFFAPLQDGDSLMVDMIVRGSNVKAAVTLERGSLLARPREDMSNSPNTLLFTIPDRNLAEGLAGFQGSTANQDFLVYNFTLTGYEGAGPGPKSNPTAK